MKRAVIAAAGLLGIALVAAPLAPASARVVCRPFLPLCVAGAVVAGAATVATLPFAAAAAAAAPYAPPPAYYPAAPAYYPAPAYVAPPPAYYGYYSAPVVTVGVGPYWYRGHWVRGPYRRWHHY